MLKINSANGPGGLAFPALRGMSAYEIAVKHGFQGTEKEWLESIAHGQPDWNQNDPDSPDFVKNRPFYIKVIEGLITREIKPYEVTGKSVADQIYAQRETAKYSVANWGGDWSYSLDAFDGSGDFFLYDGVNSIRATLAFDDTIQFAKVSAPSTPFSDGERIAVTVTWDGVLEEVQQLDPKYLPPEVAARKPLLLDANLSDHYGGNYEAGDEALEAIKTGRQILVRVPNADGGQYTAIYCPIMMYQLPLNGQYLYLFYLRDEKQDLSALLGQPAGTVLLPTYGQFQMLLSKYYNSNPLEP